MSQNNAAPQTPRAILLATDLTSDCDRAMDRAAQLAGQWHATLHVVHALRPDLRPGAWWAADKDPASPPGDSLIELTERQIRRDLVTLPKDLVVHVEEGETVDVITQVAEREQCTLIVVGTSGPTFASRIMNTTTGKLLRRLPQSLLVVKSRPRGPYQQVLVGTDFTAESRDGLEAAAAWLDAADVTVMHALDIPYQSMFLEAGREDEFARIEHATMASFVTGASLPAAVRENIHTHVAYGHPEVMLSEYSQTHGLDLVVVGALRQGLAFHVLVGGNAIRIVQSVPGDVLVLRSDAATTGRHRTA